MEEATTRRDGARRALALAGGAIASGALPALPRTQAASAKGEDEAAILAELIELSQSAAVAYRTAAGGDLLDSEIAKAADVFSTQEDEHVSALTAALEDRSGKAPKPPTASEVDGLDEPETQSEMLEYLIELENSLVGAFLGAARKLSSSDLLKTSAQILSNEAQHLVVLRQQLGDDPVPSAFVTGSDDE